MYQVLKNWLASGTYTLADAKERIDYHVACGRITVEQATELEQIAEQRAQAEPVTPDDLSTLRGRVDMLEDCIAEMAMLVYAAPAE